MEEEFKNANVFLYKNRFIVILIVAVIAYYLTRKQKTRNMVIAVLVSVILAYAIITGYAKKVVDDLLKQRELYSEHLSGEDMPEQPMAQVAPEGFQESQIQEFQRSQLARAADAEINTSPIAGYLRASVSVMEDSPFKNKDINILRAKLGIAQGVYMYGPVTVARESMAQSSVNANAENVKFNLF